MLARQAKRVRLFNFNSLAKFSVRSSCSSSTIPVVDFSDIYSHHPDIARAPQVRQLHAAFSNIGFVYIENHGIDGKLIEKVNSVATEFFNKPLDVKRKYLYCVGENWSNHNGYAHFGQEREDPTTPGDLLEGFDICSMHDCNYPDEDVPEFRPAFTELYQEGARLGLKIVEMLGHALGLKVKKTDGEWLEVPPARDHKLLVNLGYFINYWTNDKYQATEHRVVMPKDRNRVRQTIAVFIHPHANTVIQSIVGPGKYPPFVAGEHTRKRIVETHNESYENETPQA